MKVFKRILLGVAILLVLLIGGLAFNASRIRQADEVFHKEVNQNLNLRSSTFQPGQALPIRCSCDGGETRPALQIDTVPPGTQSMIVIAHDPDAPFASLPMFFFVHFAAVDMPAPLNLPEAAPADPVPNGRVLQNGMGKAAWVGACPPTGSHRYVFRAYAMDIPSLKVPDDIGYLDLLNAMKPHVLGYGELVGHYAR